MKRISFAHSRETQLLACQDEYEQIVRIHETRALGTSTLYYSVRSTSRRRLPLRHAAKVIHLITFCERRTQYPMLASAQPSPNSQIYIFLLL